MSIEQLLFIKTTASDGTYKYVALGEAHPIEIRAESGQSFQLIAFLNNEEVAITETLIIIQSGDDLVIMLEVGVHAHILDYAAAEDTSVSLLNENDESVELSAEEGILQLDNGDTLLYAQGDYDHLLELVEASYAEIQTAMDAAVTDDTAAIKTGTTHYFL